MDALLRQKWTDIKNRLSGGNIEGALEYFSEGIRLMFEYNFTLLRPRMEEILAGMKSITLVKIMEDRAEYNLVGEQGGGRRSPFTWCFRKQPTEFGEFYSIIENHTLRVWSEFNGSAS